MRCSAAEPDAGRGDAAPGTGDSTAPAAFSDPAGTAWGAVTGFPGWPLPVGAAAGLLTGAGFAALFFDEATGGAGGTAPFLADAGILAAGAETLRGAAPFPGATAGRTRDTAREGAAVF